jgi:hypothetical protein
MLATDFQQYLRDVRRLSDRTIGSRLSNCRRVEQYEGDLDEHFESDQCQNLLWRLTYSADDQDRGSTPRHRIPIDGDMRTGTATLKQAVALYVQFRKRGSR